MSDDVVDLWRHALDGDVALTQLLGDGRGEALCDADADDRRSMTEVPRRVPSDDGQAARGGVSDDIDATEHGGGLGEQTLDVEVVGQVGTHRDRGTARGEDLVDRGVRRSLIVEVAHGYRAAPAPELTRDLPTDAARAARDDGHCIHGGVVDVVADLQDGSPGGQFGGGYRMSVGPNATDRARGAPGAAPWFRGSNQ